MDLHPRRAQTGQPIHPLLAERWSSRAFRDEALEPEILVSLMEAARWAPSSFNAQPWRYLLFDRHDSLAREQAESCLVEGNAWAKQAPLLILSLVQREFERNGKPNAHAEHDLGLANMCLCVQAEVLGLAVHMMAGFDVERARSLFHVPAGFDPLVMIAIGRPGDLDDLPYELRIREEGGRERKPLNQIAWHGRFGGRELEG